MATIPNTTHGHVQTGMPVKVMNQQPLYPDLNELIEAEDCTTNPPIQSPQYDPSMPILAPSCFGLAVNSVHSLTLATQFAPPSYTPPTCDGTTSLHPAYPKLPVLYNSLQFKPTATRLLLPFLVPEDRKEKKQVLSPGLLGEIDRLTASDYDNYHPWEVKENQLVHTIITKISEEIISQLPEVATEEGFMQCLALCEKAIDEIERLPQINLENKAMLELGIRNALARDLEVFQENCLGNEFERTKRIPPHVENIPFHLNEFETRRGYYLFSSVRERFDKLLTRINHSIIKNFNETANQQHWDQLPLSEQFGRCHAWINEQLTPHATTTPKAFMHLQRRAHQAMNSFFNGHHAPLFKQAYEKGLPLPFDLPQMLDGLYWLAPNNSSSTIDDAQDPRKEFLLSVFGTDDPVELRKQMTRNAQAEKAAIEQASTPTGAPVQPKSFWSRINIFSKAPTQEQLAREATARKDAALSQVDLKEREQTLAIEKLEKYLQGIHQPIIMQPTETTFHPLVPSAPPFEPEPDIVATTPVLDDKSDAPLPTRPVINTAASNTVTVTFPSLSQRLKPTGSYIHIAFQDLLERTKDDEDLFRQFPASVQRDLMRHIFHSQIIGPAEARIENAFKKRFDRMKVDNINILYTRELSRLTEQLSEVERTPEQQQGEEILDLYYQGNIASSLFWDKLSAFPTEEKFLYYVWRTAKDANVAIADTDYNWGHEHYKDPEFVHLTMQALECVLHTS